MTQLDVRGKTAVVTGGASGIGRALCGLLGQQGAHIVIADNDGAHLDVAVDVLQRNRISAWGRTLDVRDADACAGLVDDVVAKHGRIDFFFNNAGIAPFGAFEADALPSWDICVDTNLLGVINGSAAAYPHMRRQRGGHIVNVASLAGLIPLAGMTMYGATKSAVISFSLSLRAEARRAGVHVNTICPAFVATRIRETTAAALQLPALRTPDPWYVKRMTPVDCARAIVHGVAGDRALLVTPYSAHLAWLIYRLFPAAYHRLIAPRLASAATPRPAELPRPAVAAITSS